MTVADFEAMRAAQGGCCAICNEAFSRTPKVDHCHATGKVRGLLCNGCNIAIGHFKDDAVRMEAAAAYMRRHHEPALRLEKRA